MSFGRRARIVLLLAGFLLAFVFAARSRTVRIANEEPVPESYFGLHIHRAVPTARFPVPSAWPDVGFHGWRLWDASVSWPALEPSPDRWSFGTLDSCVALAMDERVELLLPLGLSPAWASTRPEEVSAYGPGNAAPPRRIEDWRDYVRTVAARYRGRIRHYEIWNEPNLPRFFSGSAEEMLVLAREASRILKEVDPANVVVSPSATNGDAGLRWLEAYLRLGGGDCCDVVGFHFYTNGRPPETIRRLALRARALLDRSGLRLKPLWNTETGWTIPSQLPAAGRAPNAAQQTLVASYVARAMVSAWAGGVKRFYWYAWDNFTMGLTEADGRTEKPAARAFRVSRQWLTGGRMRDWCRTSAGVYSVTLSRPEGGTAWIAWAESGTGTFRAPPGGKIVRVEDLAGAVHDPSEFGSADFVRVGTSPLLLVATLP